MFVPHAIPHAIPHCVPKSLHNVIPKFKLPLGHFPTPLIKLRSDVVDALGLPSDRVSFYVKRDDMSGGPELGGNKVRKLEFLMADALLHNADAVITIGGHQSNHARATAAAAASLGLKAHLILRADDRFFDQNGVPKEHLPTSDRYCGNLLIDYMVGAKAHFITRQDYATHGSVTLCQKLAAQLIQNGEAKHPYIIPVGGSNWIGSYGFTEAISELRTQIEEDEGLRNQGGFSEIGVSCGSGGTVAGLALGMHWWNEEFANSRLRAFGVCDSPEYFHKFINDEIFPPSARFNLSEKVSFHDRKGAGYARSSVEELAFIKQFAQVSGIVLDHVYTGKALKGFIEFLLQQEQLQQSRKTTSSTKNVLFWHTGGFLGLHEAANNHSSHSAQIWV